ncbi:hypothetical protein SASPL_117172 [Salvia splendens]|uniref:Splicing factor U2af large subunit n=1 Tax=Salvia splendens TaxID=180675 RepID=A0A8X8XXU0_SALSN|nr:hypothetical protein SASPL_117172 [Salvia splendens]
MPRHSREDDRRRSLPYDDSSRDRRSHHHKHKDHCSDDKEFKRTDWNQDGESRHRYHKEDGQRSARSYGGRSRNEDYGDRRHKESSRYYKHGGDGEKQQRQRSPNQSDDKSHSKRTSGFDVAPPANGALPSPSEHVAGVSMASQAIPGMLPNMLSSDSSQLGLFPIQVMTQQATRHARRVYVGGLPPLSNEQTISTFFSHVMNAIGGNIAGPGDAVVNVYINHEKKFAFVEMRTVEEASNAMALDGIIFEGVSVRVRRPTDYNPSLAAPLGPSQPGPYLNLAAAGLTPGMHGESDGADRIFIGGVPYYFSEAQMKELLESFGPLRGFDLVKDRDTGNSKGYGFCFYQDPSVTDVACAALNGLKVGDKTLTVRRATVSGQLKPEQEYVIAQAQQHIAVQVEKMVSAAEAGALNIPSGQPPTSVEIPTKVLCLTEVVTTDELMDDGEYEEILEDMRDECQKFGELIAVVIPRPVPDSTPSNGVGKVFLEYSDTTGCMKAKFALSGRKFGGNSVTALYYPEDKYYDKDFTA